jgi:hypothetical protein
LGLELGLDPQLTNIISLSLGAIQGQIIENPSTTLEQAFSNIRGDVFSSLASYGVSELASSLGLNPRISSVISLPIAGAIGRSFDVGHILGEDLIQSVLDGLAGGALQLGLDFAIDELDIDDPLLESLTSAALTRSVSNFFDPNGNLIEDLLKAAGDFTEEFLGDVTSTEFMMYAAEHGYAEALQTFATNIFSREALEEIHGVGGIAQIISGRSQLIDYNGITLTKVNITDREGFVLGAQGQFVGTFRTVNGVQEESFGQFDISAGKSKLINGTVRQVHPSGEVSYIEVREGKTYRFVLKVPEENPALSQATVKYVPCAGSEIGCIEFDLKEGQAAEPVWSWQVVENYNGELNIDGFDVVDGLFFVNGEISFNVSDSIGTSLSLDLSDNAGPSVVDRLDDDLYLLANGILNNKSKSEGAPAYLKHLKEDIVLQSQGNIKDQDIITASTFFTSPIINILMQKVMSLAQASGVYGDVLKRVAGELLVKIFNGGKDVLSWLAEAADPYASFYLVEEVQAAMQAYFDYYGDEHRFRDIIAVGYSGGFVPVVEALTHPGYFAKTLIALGAATIRPEDAVRDLLVKIMEAADYLSNPLNVAREVLEASLNRVDLALIGLLGVGLGQGLIQEMVEFIAQETPSEAYNRYVDRLENLNGLMDDVFDGYVLDDLTGTNTHMIVNMYGTRDILSQLRINGVSIGGYRENMGGFTASDRDHALVNIEIVGASHFDYMRPDNPSPGILDIAGYLATDREWNERVSAFVAQLIGQASNIDQLDQFLFERPDIAFFENEKWVIRLPGWENRV